MTARAKMARRVGYDPRPLSTPKPPPTPEELARFKQQQEQLMKRFRSDAARRSAEELMPKLGDLPDDELVDFYNAVVAVLAAKRPPEGS